MNRFSYFESSCFELAVETDTGTRFLRSNLIPDTDTEGRVKGYIAFTYPASDKTEALLKKQQEKEFFALKNAVDSLSKVQQQVTASNSQLQQQYDLFSVPLEVGAVAQVNNIYFVADAAFLQIPSYPELDKVVAFLQKNKNLKVEIGGHSNGLCDDAFCQKLSTSRAKTCVDYLVSKGIAANLASLRYQSPRALRMSTPRTKSTSLFASTPLRLVQKTEDVAIKQQDEEVAVPSSSPIVAKVSLETNPDGTVTDDITDDEPSLLQHAERHRHRLRAYALGGRQLARRPTALAIDPREQGELRRGQFTPVVRLAEPATEPADDDADVTGGVDRAGAGARGDRHESRLDRQSRLINPDSRIVRRRTCVSTRPPRSPT